jgi:hypothetical protein
MAETPNGVSLELTIGAINIEKNIKKKVLNFIS